MSEKNLSHQAKHVAKTLVDAWKNGALLPTFEADEGPYGTLRAPVVSLLNRPAFNELVEQNLVLSTDAGSGRVSVTLLPQLRETVYPPLKIDPSNMDVNPRHFRL